jgi:hypothetical protein
MDTDPVDPDLDVDGWRKPAFVPIELETHASWLREMGGRTGNRAVPNKFKA